MFPLSIVSLFPASARQYRKKTAPLDPEWFAFGILGKDYTPKTAKLSTRSRRAVNELRSII
jgi:hypothetical protein